jgi:YHS domain-containing protein
MVLLFLLSMAALPVLVRKASLRRHAVDPVCGMAVEMATATLTSDWRGKTIYFCAPACKKDFDADPESYILIPRSGAAE